MPVVTGFAAWFVTVFTLWGMVDLTMRAYRFLGVPGGILAAFIAAATAYAVVVAK